MVAELVVTAVFLIQSIRSDEWQPVDSLRHQMNFESLEACERAKDELADEIAAFVARTLEEHLLFRLDAPALDEHSRVTTTAACQRQPS